MDINLDKLEAEINEVVNEVKKADENIPRGDWERVTELDDIVTGALDILESGFSRIEAFKRGIPQNTHTG